MAALGSGSSGGVRGGAAVVLIQLVVMPSHPKKEKAGDGARRSTTEKITTSISFRTETDEDHRLPSPDPRW
jgi:hypothetical protein